MNIDGYHRSYMRRHRKSYMDHAQACALQSIAINRLHVAKAAQDSTIRMILPLFDCFITCEQRIEGFLLIRRKKTALLVHDWLSSSLSTIYLYHIVRFFIVQKLVFRSFVQCSTHMMALVLLLFHILSFMVIYITR